jgi:hypothetical protein
MGKIPGNALLLLTLLSVVENGEPVLKGQAEISALWKV